MLLHFEHDVDGRGYVEALAGDLKRLVDRRHRGFGELHVHRGAGDLNYFSYILWHKNLCGWPIERPPLHLRFR